MTVKKWYIHESCIKGGNIEYYAHAREVVKALGKHGHKLIDYDHLDSCRVNGAYIPENCEEDTQSNISDALYEADFVVLGPFESHTLSVVPALIRFHKEKRTNSKVSTFHKNVFAIEVTFPNLISIDHEKVCKVDSLDVLAEEIYNSLGIPIIN